MPSPLPELYGGVLCLDFANTVDSRAQPPLEEHVHRYEDLLRWDRLAAVLDPAEVEALTRVAQAQPEAADAAHARAVEVREAIFRFFVALARGGVPEPADAAIMQRAYVDALQHARLIQDGDRFRWTWEGDDLNRAWWPVARSAIELATGAVVDRVKVCASDEGCAGLFLDTTKNHSRRWCSMGACGVEVKVKRQTARPPATRNP